MIESKLFEVRDTHTFIPVLATRLLETSGLEHDTAEAERYLARRCGYFGNQVGRVLLTKIIGEQTHSDPYDWTNGPALREAHVYIQEHWGELTSGEVIDVGFLRGDSYTPKVSERLQPIS